MRPRANSPLPSPFSVAHGEVISVDFSSGRHSFRDPSKKITYDVSLGNGFKDRMVNKVRAVDFHFDRHRPKHLPDWRRP